MRIAVIGVGGAGGYFGARLADAGHDVSFIARGENLAAIRRSGLRIESASGDTVVTAKVTHDPAEIGFVDVVILGVKAWQVSEASRAVAPIVGPATAVLPLQNGIEASQQIADALGAAHALGGTAKVISFLVEPGHIKQIGTMALLEFGELDGAISPRVEALRDALAAATGVTAVLSTDVRATVWAKFLFIASWSGVGAVTRAPIGEIREAPETRALVESSMREIEAVARANEIRLPPNATEAAMRFIDTMPPQSNTSMHRDIVDGKPSELENLTGAVVRAGAAAGVPTPTNAFLYRALLLLERRARGG